MLGCGRSRVTGWEISRKCDLVSRAIESVKAILTSGEFDDTSSFFKVTHEINLIYLSQSRSHQKCYNQWTCLNAIESFQILSGVRR